jgi:hypothetical protein
VAVDARDEDRELLVRATALRAPLVRVARRARSNSMGYLVFGVLTVLFSLSTQAADLAALGVAAVLLFAGLHGRRLAVRLRDGDADAARLLARNELILLAAISIYGVLMLTVINPMSDEIDQMLGGSGMPLDSEGLRRTIYLSVIGITVLYQGGLAWQYRRSVPAAELYVAEVPDWARQAVSSIPG